MTDETDIARTLRRAFGATDDPELPPIPPGQVRVICDPETVLRWFAAREPTVIDWDYNPFAPDRMR
jgi:hypothetical protein